MEMKNCIYFLKSGKAKTLDDGIIRDILLLIRGIVWQNNEEIR